MIDSLILLSIGAQDEESDSISVTQQDYTRQRKLQENAKEAIEKACSMFESCGDVPNYALCEANMGRLFQVIGSCHRKFDQKYSATVKDDCLNNTRNMCGNNTRNCVAF